VFATVLVVAAGCGARSGLPGGEANEGGAGTGASGGGGNGGGGGTGGDPGPCVDGTVEACGSDVGECKPGTRTCVGDMFGPCQGAIGPVDEMCNGLDDDCDGAIDNGFHIGEACDGPDSDLCADDVMTCDGCTSGPDILEVCNGVDDNCNGIVDADCQVGDCQPTLLVTGSTPSSPSCIDFPVEAGSTGVIEYPCGGGSVTANLGGVQFSGSVNNGFVSLDGVAVVTGPDGCQWETDHHIQGNIPSGTLSYGYQEHVVSAGNPPKMCWSPCTETGSVDIQWLDGL